jgi:hypothetical protein
MATRITMEMPESALRRLMDMYRDGEPRLKEMFKEFGVIAIIPRDELSLAQWENEGGSTV